MARIVVETDDRRHTLLDEREVSAVQLETRHSAEQLLAVPYQRDVDKVEHVRHVAKPIGCG